MRNENCDRGGLKHFICQETCLCDIDENIICIEAIREALVSR